MTYRIYGKKFGMGTVNLWPLHEVESSRSTMDALENAIERGLINEPGVYAILNTSIDGGMRVVRVGEIQPKLGVIEEIKA